MKLTRTDWLLVVITGSPPFHSATRYPETVGLNLSQLPCPRKDEKCSSGYPLDRVATILIVSGGADFLVSLQCANFPWSWAHNKMNNFDLSTINKLSTIPHLGCHTICNKFSDRLRRPDIKILHPEKIFYVRFFLELQTIYGKAHCIPLYGTCHCNAANRRALPRWWAADASVPLGIHMLGTSVLEVTLKVIWVGLGGSIEFCHWAGTSRCNPQHFPSLPP